VGFDVARPGWALKVERADSRLPLPLVRRLPLSEALCGGFDVRDQIRIWGCSRVEMALSLLYSAVIAYAERFSGLSSWLRRDYVSGFLAGFGRLIVMLSLFVLLILNASGLGLQGLLG